MNLIKPMKLGRLNASIGAVKRFNIAYFSDHTEVIQESDPGYLKEPAFDFNKSQPLHVRKARLIYQSRKRGMLENDLLLSTFIKKYLDGFNEKQTIMYDRLINSASNEWDLFHWIVQKKETPEEFNNEVMDLLKAHAKNKDKQALRFPDL